MEFTKLMPLHASAASLILSRIAVFSSTGTSNGSFSNELFHVAHDLWRRDEFDLLASDRSVCFGDCGGLGRYPFDLIDRDDRTALQNPMCR